MDLVTFINMLTTDEVVCIMQHTSPEDWEGDDDEVIRIFKYAIADFM